MLDLLMTINGYDINDHKILELKIKHLLKHVLFLIMTMFVQLVNTSILTTY